MKPLPRACGPTPYLEQRLQERRNICGDSVARYGLRASSDLIQSQTCPVRESMPAMKAPLSSYRQRERA